MKTAYKSTINQLKVYRQAHTLEEQVLAMVKELDAEEFYPTPNALWRATVATAHYIAEAHERYSYTIKIQSLQYARISAEEAIKHLEEFAHANKIDVKEMAEDFNSIVKQCWGLIKYLQGKQREHAEQNLPVTSPAYVGRGDLAEAQSDNA